MPMRLALKVFILNILINFKQLNKEGQMIEFINELEEGWATGKLIDSGKVGHYPTNFVEVS